MWISYVLWRGDDTALYAQAVLALVSAGVGLIGSYIFGAVWDYKVYADALKAGKKEEDDQPYNGY